MRTLFLLFVLTGLLIPSKVFSQKSNKREFEVKEGDKTYTMKKYFMCFLYKGENRDQDTATANKIQRAHMKHIGELAEKGVIQLAGPFGHNGDLRGILLFDVVTKEEAIKHVKADPAVQARRLRYEVYPWWGAKGSKLE